MNQVSTQGAKRPKNYHDNYEKGGDFEQYVIELFNKHNFNLKNWRKSQKSNSPSSLIDHFNPDLEIELIFSRARKYRFAVECKWRRTFKDGKIKWADDSQICSYRIFQDRVRIPVFVVIGIGGEPGSPEKLFVTPLNNICMYNEVPESKLIPFKRKPTHKFYYDIHQLKLF